MKNSIKRRGSSRPYLDEALGNLTFSFMLFAKFFFFIVQRLILFLLILHVVSKQLKSFFFVVVAFLVLQTLARDKRAS